MNAPGILETKDGIITKISCDGKEWSVGEKLPGSGSAFTYTITKLEYDPVGYWKALNNIGAWVKLPPNPSLNNEGEMGQMDEQQYRELTYDERREWDAKFKNKTPQPPLPEQGKEEDAEIERIIDKHCRPRGENKNWYSLQNITAAMKEYAALKSQPSSEQQKISIGEILMRHHVTPLAELVDDLEDNQRQPSFTMPSEADIDEAFWEWIIKEERVNGGISEVFVWESAIQWLDTYLKTVK